MEQSRLCIVGFSVEKIVEIAAEGEIALSAAEAEEIATQNGAHIVAAMRDAGVAALIDCIVKEYGHRAADEPVEDVSPSPCDDQSSPTELPGGSDNDEGHEIG